MVSVVLSSLVFAGATAQLAVAWATALPEDAVLKVGDTVATEDQFQQRVQVLEALYGVKPPKQGSELSKFNRDAVKSIAVSLIIDRAAEREQVVVADKKAQEALDKIIDQQLPGGRDDFVKFLSSQGIAERHVVDEVKRQLAINTLLQQITAGVPAVTAEQVRKEYQDRKKEMVSPETRHLRNIVVNSEDTASRILQQAREGADFSQLAAEHSLDQSTKDKGGDIGELTADQLDKQFAEAAFKAGDKSVFGPVKSSR